MNESRKNYLFYHDPYSNCMLSTEQSAISEPTEQISSSLMDATTTQSTTSHWLRQYAHCLTSSSPTAITVERIVSTLSMTNC
jgi:hypothetical protein